MTTEPFVASVTAPTFDTRTWARRIYLLASLTGGRREPLIMFMLTSISMLVGAAILTRDCKFEDHVSTQ